MNVKQEHRDLIVELAKLFKPEVYVEIGAKNGYTFNRVMQHAKNGNAVDIRLKGIKRAENVFCHQMTSNEFAKKWKAPIDMLFIDGDHNRDQVLKDFYSIGKWVRAYTGLILLHDTWPVTRSLLDPMYCGDAWRAAAEIRREFPKDYEIVTLPGPHAGLSIIRKATNHGWMDQ